MFDSMTKAMKQVVANAPNEERIMNKVERIRNRLSSNVMTNSLAHLQPHCAGNDKESF